MTGTLVKTKSVDNYGYKVSMIDIERIMPNRSQPRTVFDNESLAALSESIKTHGILQPLTVRPYPDKSDFSNFQYELIAGERRLRASKLAGLKKVPCIITESDTTTSAALAIIENLHRSDLGVFEEATAIAALIEIYGLTQEEAAQQLSMTQASVANKLRLLKLSAEEKEKISENNLSERHARALLRIKSTDIRKSVLDHIIKYNLNVRQTEEYSEKMLDKSDENKPTTEKVKTKDLKELIFCIHKAVEETRNGGLAIRTKQTETDSDIVVTISIPKNQSVVSA